MPKDIQNSGGFTSSGGMYRPPEYFDSGFYKKGDIDHWHGQSRMVAQGGYARLKKMQEGDGVLLVRFEMPYDVWCGGCGEIIAMGVRFNNAEKKKVGKYFSTPIFTFRVRHFCGNWVTIQNDPKHAAFNVTDGGREKITPGNKASALAEADAAAAAAAETAAKDAASGVSSAAQLRLMRLSQEFAAAKGVDSAAYLLRRHKAQKGAFLQNSAEAKAQKAAFGISLLPACEAERQRASDVSFRSSSSRSGGTGAAAAASVAERVRAMQSTVDDREAEKKRRRREDKAAAAAVEYQVSFVRAQQGGGGADDEADDVEDEEAPPTVYRLVGATTLEQVNALLSRILGEPEPRCYHFLVNTCEYAVSPAVRQTTPLHQLFSKPPFDAQRITGEGVVRLQFSSRPFAVQGARRDEEVVKAAAAAEEAAGAALPPAKKRRKMTKKKKGEDDASGGGGIFGNALACYGD
eukprot:Rhum_TRINITY_DN14508_c4_g1::Rhum_TRINITY_DN14508_c4_g1_i1::g.94725::m.94725/K13115/CCDC130; coiled-coil domain-containing protein 130